jgi:hypothetical protein
MLKISKEDFMEEIKAELYGYEEIEETLVEDFVERLEVYFKEKKGKNVTYADGITIKLKDESDLFMIADGFLAAVTNDEVEQYWQKWTL